MANPRNLADIAPLVTESSNNVAFSNTVNLSGGTANGVLYLNGSKVATSGSALTFDGSALTLGGATPRLLSNMSGTLSSRFIIQNSTTNGNSRIYLYPNGTGNISAVNGTNNSDINAADYQAFDLAVIGTTDVRLSSNAVGAAAFLPLTFYTNGSEQMRLTSTGLGIGLGGGSPGEKLQVAGAIRATGAVAANTTGGILAYQGSSTVMLGSWGADASTYGAIQFYQSNSTGTLNRTGMLLDSSGKLRIGGSGTPAAVGDLQINTAAPMLRLEETTTGGSKRLDLGVTSGGNAYIGANQSSQTLEFQTVGTPRMTLDASGLLQVGTTSNTGGARVDVVSNATSAYTARSSSSGASTTVKAVRSVDGGATNFANAQYDALSHAWILSNSTQAMTLDASGNLMLNGTTVLQSAKLSVHSGSIAAENGGVDGSFENAFVGVYSVNNNEHNVIQTAVSTAGTGSGFRFRASLGGGSSTTYPVLDLTRDQTIFYTANTERARITNEGKFIANSTISANQKLSLIGLDINSNDSPNFIKIRTTIPVASANADFTVSIKGFVYGSYASCNLLVHWHYYNSTFWNANVSSSGTWAPTVRLSGENGFVCIVLSSPGYWPKLYVESMYSSNYNNLYASGWTWVDENATGSPLVTCRYLPLSINGITASSMYYIDIKNTNMTDNSSGFDFITDDADGGGTTWSIVKDSIINLSSSSGGHSGNWGRPVYLEVGHWRIKGAVRLSSVNGSIHGNTPAGNYKFTIQFEFQLNGGGCATGGLRWDVDTLGDGTRAGFVGATSYISSAGTYQLRYSTNGYEGIKQVYITDLILERVA